MNRREQVGNVMQRLWRLRQFAWILPLGLLAGLVLVQPAVGQESPAASPTASPGPVGEPSPSAGGSPTQYPLVTVRPIDIGSPSPGASPFASLPIETLAPIPSGLASPIPAPTPIIHPSDGTSNTCYDCHIAINDKQHGIASQWKDSAHAAAGIGCADCHGGDPTSKSVTTAMSTDAGFIGVPDRKTTVGICASCHSDPTMMRPYGLPTDMFAQYQTSVHGLLLYSANDSRVAICTDCHGVHDIKKASDPTAAVYPMNVPQLCASCHSDPQIMGPYGIPTDQYDLYKQSIHGQTLLVQQDMRAPTCASCHGSHGAKPPQSDEVVNVCGKCHTATQALYMQSKHSQLQDAAPKCVTCHGAHDVVLPTEARFFHLSPPNYECLTCHDPVDQSLKLQSARFVNDADRRCDTCHHPDSLIYSQITAIHDSLTAASTAYDKAQSRIDEAAQLGMLVTDADVTLAQAKTSLIQARAAVHTTNLSTIDSLSKDVITQADQAGEVASAKINESTFRREAMVVVVVVILLNVLALAAWKRRLDRILHGGGGSSD